MTFSSQLRRSLRRRDAHQSCHSIASVAADEPVVTNGHADDEPGASPTKTHKDSRLTTRQLRQAAKRELKKKKEEAEEAPSPPASSGKLERKPSLRYKFGRLLKGTAELPAAINRGFRRNVASRGDSTSNNARVRGNEASCPNIDHLLRMQELQREEARKLAVRPPHQVRQQARLTASSMKHSVKWYSSLGSLEEKSEEETSRPSSFAYPTSLQDLRVMGTTSLENLLSVQERDGENSENDASNDQSSHASDLSLDSSKPPCEASHPPVADQYAYARENEEPGESDTFVDQQVVHRLGDVKPFKNSLPALHGSSFWSGVRNTIRQSVRSRSLSQLDALGTSILDAGEHQMGGEDSGQQQQHQQHQQHPSQSPYYHQMQYHSHTFGESSPRFLVPNAASADGNRPNRTRHKLSRSQVSSSEYFSVDFDVGDETSVIDREEFLPATKGTYLVEILGPVCERRGIDLSRVDVLSDSFNGPLSITTTETSSLGGKNLRITAKDEKSSWRSASQKGSQNVTLHKTSGSYRGRGNRFFSASTEDSSVDSEFSAAAAAHASSAKGTAGPAGLNKTGKQRWSSFFTGNKGTKMDPLIEKLNFYSKYGVPKLPEAHQFLSYEFAPSDEAVFSLEDDWREIVENSELLSDKQQHQQTAIWELVETEAAYIKTLKVVTDLFMACLCGLQASSILIEVDRARLFCNIPEIYAANRYFWTAHVSAMLDAARSTRKPLDTVHLLPAFENFEEIFAPYARYCSEQGRRQQYCREIFQDNDVFTAYLAWCETQKECNRLRLLDILVKPMQRITKYSLLLKAVRKNTENEDQQSELTAMIKSVDTFVGSINSAMRCSEETARLATAASRLESYDAVESKDDELLGFIKKYCNLDIMNAPMPGCPKDSLRILLREGDLKFRDPTSSKMEVHLLLMTDMLLICKAAKKVSSSASMTFKVIRQPYVVDRIRIHDLKENSGFAIIYLNEFGTTSAAFVLSASEPNLAKSWVESIRKAQKQLAVLRRAALNSVLTTTVSRQASTYLGDTDYEMDEFCGMEGVPKTPRGSSRASRVSSLAHSHSMYFFSGSMEMEGASPGSSNFLPSYNQSRNVSMETTEPPRASSVSSEEGTESAAAAAAAALAGHNQRQLQIRRSLLNKSPTPNTLSVQVPAYSCLGQSLPNLTLATSPQTSTVSPTPPSSLLIVPQITKSKDALLSPGHRGEFTFKKKGISYPPPSPPRGALRRTFAISQSRNPPLVKTRHINASATQSLQTTVSLDTEGMEERRRRLESTHRVASTSSIAEEKK
ncbi:pleckstrin homology domain-containing family G member 5 isoform X2 [Copidosoma floridanum]|uniref:pleckstrin homology domain-containing family G member 5 isoform X2 n=1 Tax=Copidosoma floridanum TaxID=29053 RepID=UPI0006C98904|nr:pleckstrin homology domain-containing family G member 5 isoform X2 [Copidosoma floridanum]